MDDPNQPKEDSESDDKNGSKQQSSGEGERMIGEAHEPEKDAYTTNTQNNRQ